MPNESKNFENMKTDVIKIYSDVNILKDEFQEIHAIFKQITSRISNLEDENNNLKNQNKNLIKNIKHASSNHQRNEVINIFIKYISVEDDYNSDARPIKGTNYIPMENNINQSNCKSKYQSNFQVDNTNNNFNSNQKKSKETNTMDEPNMSGFSDLNSMQNNSSIEMNINMKNNSQITNPGKYSNKRFLIPK